MNNNLKRAALCFFASSALLACKNNYDIVSYSPANNTLKGGTVYEINVDEDKNKFIYGLASDFEGSEMTGISMFLAKYSADDVFLWDIKETNFANLAVTLFMDRSADNVLSVDAENRVFYSRYSNDDVVTSLISSDGDVIWEKSESQHYSVHNSVAIAKNGLYLWKRSDARYYEVTAYSEAGDELWHYSSQLGPFLDEVTEMLTDGDSTLVKDPLNVSKIDKNGELLASISAGELGVSHLHDMSTNNGKLALLGESNKEFFVILLDSELKVVWKASVGTHAQRVADGLLSLGEDDVVCYSMSPPHQLSEQTLKLGAVKDGSSLWSITDANYADMAIQDLVHIERVDGQCHARVNQFKDDVAVKNSTYKMIAIGDSGQHTIVHEQNKFQAFASTTIKSEIFAAGSYYKKSQYVWDTGIAAYFKALLVPDASLGSED